MPPAQQLGLLSDGGERLLKVCQALRELQLAQAFRPLGRRLLQVAPDGEERGGS
jgi:hypothetical protein